MDLRENNSGGYVKDNQTYCCEGCAEGTGCTCEFPIARAPRQFNRWGNRGQRNAENSIGDNNLGGMNSSDRAVGRRTESPVDRNVISPRRVRAIGPQLEVNPKGHRARKKLTTARKRKLIGKLSQPAKRSKHLVERPAKKQIQK
jgi:hypothetical protein